MKTAIILGATGLVGSELTKKLLADDRYENVKIFVRRKSGLLHPKLDELVVNFDEILKWKDKITGDELYSAMGTTLKKAGSEDAQYKIDFTFQYKFAQLASKNGVEKYLLVSSAGANIKSGNFYLKMKGELDEKVAELNFIQTFIFRPSILAGDRKERRIGEVLAIPIMNFLSIVIPPLRKYRPIEGAKVAEAMIKSANQNITTQMNIYELDQIAEI